MSSSEKGRVKRIERYVEIVSEIKRHGLSIRELLLDYLPDEINHVPEIIRETFTNIIHHREYTFTECLDKYKKIPKIETLTRYVMFVLTIVLAAERLRIEKLYECIKNLYSEVSSFIENPNYNDTLKIANTIGQNYELNVKLTTRLLRSYVKGINKIVKAHRENVFEWIFKFRKIHDFEHDLRRYFYSDFSGERRRKIIRMIIRTFSHETNIPIALTILRSGEYRNYTPAADMYSTLVTMRSGAFLIFYRDDKVRRIRVNLTYGMPLRLKLKQVKGIIRRVAKFSRDPILYERGAFDIGYKYCSKSRCEECVLSRVCEKYLNISIK